VLDRLAATLLTAALGTSGGAAVVHRGQLAHISLTTSVASQASCAAQVVYAGGCLQQTGIKRAAGGRVPFAIRVPRHVAYGPAHWTVRCGIQLQRSGTWRVAPLA